MKKVSHSRSCSPRAIPLRHLPLVDLLVDTRTELTELAMRAGLRVFTTMLEEDRTAICGPRYAHQPDRSVGRAGTVPSEVVLGGRKVLIQRPRVRSAAGAEPLPTFDTMAHTGPLDRRVVGQMLVGVATRQYARSLEPLSVDITSRGRSKSAVSRRFVAKTRAQRETWQSEPVDGLDLAALLLDGVHVGEHGLIVALGVAAFRGADENLHLIERFTLVSPDTLLYEFTVDDPTAFTRPWRAVMSMHKTDGRIFEYACHEANYAMTGILRGARAEEKGR